MSQASHYGMREKPQPVPPVPCSAWDKPLGSQLRSADLEAANMLGVAMDGVNLEGASSPGSEKVSVFHFDQYFVNVKSLN